MRVIRVDDPGFKQAIEEFKQRASLDDEIIEAGVREVINNVRHKGDQALLSYTEKFDGVCLENKDLTVDRSEIENAYRNISGEGVNAIKFAIDKITAYHSRQRRNTWIQPGPEGEILGQMITPLQRVGIYVPGGKAPYPSSVLMCAIPAKIAGVDEIYCVSPPQSNKGLNPYILAAADMVGVKKIYKMGGAQAVAALAFGTETIPKVDKIVGPGNIYVTMAKKLVFGHVNIDMLAGPSEILIVADETAPPQFIAADLLSQAEHDERASSILITVSSLLIDSVNKEIETQMNYLERKETCRLSLTNYGLMILVKDMEQAIDLANQIGPEHLELALKDPLPWLGKVRNAGSVFMGYFTPEPVGDYIAGPNHVLPTGGTARFFSALGVDDFTKRSGVSFYSQKCLKEMGEKAIILAGIEGLNAHAKSIEYRLKFMV
ncbi:MAG: histidinol dehydrogenase [bacterium]